MKLAFSVTGPLTQNSLTFMTETDNYETVSSNHPKRFLLRQTIIHVYASLSVQVISSLNNVRMRVPDILSPHDSHKVQHTNQDLQNLSLFL